MIEPACGLSLGAAGTLLLMLPALLPAQTIRRSREAAVRQKIADTWIELRYRRPVARGRSPLFGNIVETAP